ncbi:MAG: thioredoxin domain-containing protein [Bacteroidia bacterium]
MFTNALIHESSPYLLQHAHNPVAWQAWNEPAWEQARKENKLVLISIGYSACHWCHVMEHESFEDDTVARIMNDHFICIKVDREERPDIDQIYMTAVQIMSGHGGWPLNCIALPDGRPVYGGTYFRKQEWMNVLFNLADLWKTEPEKALHYAANLTEGIRQSELIKVKPDSPAPDPATLLSCWDKWSHRLDTKEGGPNRAPKFPLPNNYQFLLQLAEHKIIRDKEKAAIREHVELTLKKMAFGGIYDQIGGGFSRYSTDSLWKVPHFEKMLYDNAQLVSLYSEAFCINPDPLYRQVVYETLAFVSRELLSPEGLFCSALDADSEGTEGKYYVWTKSELEKICGPDFELFSAYYEVNETGYWEHDNYILLRKKEETELAAVFGLSPENLQQKIALLKDRLLAEREKRTRPGLDDKCLASWNALMIKAYTDAYRAFGEPRFLERARNTAALFLQSFDNGQGGLMHSFKNGKASINGFLEDYCFASEALTALYECTFEEHWLQSASALVNYTLLHFYDSESGFFYFTSSLDPELIARKFELSDNVIPASNSSMAKCLFRLGHLLGERGFCDKAIHMITQVQAEMEQYGAGYSNWALLQLWISAPFYEIAIVGKAVEEKLRDFLPHYLPNMIFAGSNHASSLPLLKDRYREKETLIYICRDQTCLEPVREVTQALALLQQAYEF